MGAEDNTKPTCASVPTEAVNIQPVIRRLLPVILEPFVLAFVHPEVCTLVPEADLANLGAESRWLAWNQLVHFRHKVGS